MIFEIRRNGKTVMRTESERCIPDRETLKSMVRSGYKLYRDGKAVRP